MSRLNLAGILIGILIAVGCSSKKETPVTVEVPADKGMPSIDVPELLKHHEKFRGKEVELTGWASRFEDSVMFQRCDRPYKSGHSEFHTVAIARIPADQQKLFRTIPTGENKLDLKLVVITGTVETEGKLGTLSLRKCRLVRVLEDE